MKSRGKEQSNEEETSPFSAEEDEEKKINTVIESTKAKEGGRPVKLEIRGERGGRTDFEEMARRVAVWRSNREQRATRLLTRTTSSDQEQRDRAPALETAVYTIGASAEGHGEGIRGVGWGPFVVGRICRAFDFAWSEPDDEGREGGREGMGTDRKRCRVHGGSF